MRNAQRDRFSLRLPRSGLVTGRVDFKLQQRPCMARPLLKFLFGSQPKFQWARDSSGLVMRNSSCAGDQCRARAKSHLTYRRFSHELGAN
jgi:hypothetical protein